MQLHLFAKVVSILTIQPPNILNELLIFFPHVIMCDLFQSIPKLKLNYQSYLLYLLKLNESQTYCDKVEIMECIGVSKKNKKTLSPYIWDTGGNKKNGLIFCNEIRHEK